MPAPAPVPDDLLWFRQGQNLRAWCACGHSAVLRLDALRRAHGIGPQTPVSRIVERLRCRRCGGRAVEAGLARRDGRGSPAL